MSRPIPFLMSTTNNVPAYNIQSFSVAYYANRLQGYPMNYIELQFSFSSLAASGISYLVFEFHARDQDQNVLYTDGSTLFPGVQSGDEFPCTCPTTGGLVRAAGQRLICTYYQGSSLGLAGKPHQIYVTNFVLTANTPATIQFLIRNPDAATQRSLRLTVKGFGNSSTALYSGKIYYGAQDIENGFSLGANEKTEGYAGNVNPSLVTVAQPWLTPGNAPGNTQTLTVAFSNNFTTRSVSDFVLVQIPLRLQLRNSSLSVSYAVEAYSDVCTIGLADD